MNIRKVILKDVMKSAAVILMALLLLSEVAGAQTCAEGNCYEGWGVIYWPKGNKYEGEFKEGRFDGKGALTYQGAVGDVLKNFNWTI